MRRNELRTAQFSLPMDDPKRQLCSHLNFVEIYGEPTQATPAGRYYGLYRIMPTKTTKAVETNRVTYELEHVLSTLLDDVIDGLLPALINQTTTVNLNRLLNLQTTQNWVLGDVDFERYFQYSFENENGLLAPILSIPKPFDEDYEFTFDTQSYPWTLNLVRPSDAIQSEVRWGKDMISFDEVSDPTEIVNHIIPKGQGEGVNQLTIEDENNGVKYLEDTESIAEWGLRKYIWIDRRFKNADSLKESAQSLLRQWKDPKISFEINAVDLSVLPEYAHEQRLLGTKTRIIVYDSDIDRTYDARIIEAKIPDLAKEFEVEYKIANRLDDAATIQADVERKQRINEAYSQGATNLIPYSYYDNADASHPAKIKFWIPSDLTYINVLNLTFETEEFRAYSQATEGGGATVESTSSGGGTTESTTSGGGTTETTSSGGGTSKSTNSGGGTTQSSSNDGSHSHIMFSGEAETQPISSNERLYEVRDLNGNYAYAYLPTGSPIIMRTWEDSGAHSHSVSIPSHSHSFSTPNHSHSVTIPNHSHSVTIPNHSHSITLPDHTHDIKHGIFTLNNIPSQVGIKVDGNSVSHSGNNASELDLIPYLSKDSNGKILRGQWHEVTLTPNGLGRINANIISRLFIQSDLGGKY